MTKPAKGETVLLTGATGFIASHTILALQDAGYTVRGTARSADRRPALEATLSAYAGRPVSIELFPADLMRDDGWRAAATGCDHIIHMASPLPTNGPQDADDLIVPAREGTLRVMRAAREAGARRIIVTSSFAAVGYGWGDKRPAMLTEEHWSNPDNFADNTAYTRSKAIAEKAAWEYARAHSLNMTTINPVAVLGPAMSADVSASLELVSQPMLKKLPLIPRISFGIVDVRDVADAHVLALENPAAIGERFIVTDEVLWFADVMDVLREAYPKRGLASGRMPDWLLRLLANVNPVVKQIIPELGQFRNVTSAKARDMLGWSPRPAREAILASAQSLVQLGLV